jgi:uncharacterized protein
LLGTILKQGKKGKSLKELGTYTRNLSIDMTEGCSLRCKYCFADFASEKKENRKLTKEVMKAAIDWLFDDETSGTVEEVNNSGGLGFEPWGGEPLHNFEMVKETYEYLIKKSEETGKKIGHIGGTTNAVEFTEERLQWCKERNINWLISLDGIKENQDSQRVFPDGSGSFDIVDKNLDLYKKVYGYAPYVRMSLHPDYIDNMYKSYEYVLGKGIHSYFFSPVYEANWTEQKYKDLEDVLVKIYEKLILDYKNGFPKVDNKFVDDMLFYILESQRRGINLEDIETTGSYDPKLHTLSRGMHLPKPCGAGSTYFGISVDGQIYICHRFNKHGLDADKVKFTDRYGWLGNVWEGIHNVELFNVMKEWDVKDLEHCKYCKLKYYCKGSCYASNYDDAGSIKSKNEKSCRINESLYNAALRIIDLFKKYGMFDYERNDIVYIDNYNKGGFQGKHGQTIETCMCNNATYYFDGLNQLLNNEKPDDIEELKMQILEGGVNVLLDMYKEIKMYKSSQSKQGNQVKEKLKFFV